MTPSPEAGTSSYSTPANFFLSSREKQHELQQYEQSPGEEGGRGLVLVSSESDMVCVERERGGWGGEGVRGEGVGR